MRIFYLSNHRILAHPLAHGNPLRLDARGAISDGDGWAATLLRIAPHSTRERVALVARPGARVRVGARRIAELAELSDRDHVLLDEAELIVSCDALPAPVETPPGVRCGTCCEEVSGLLGCPRCQAARCESCWRRSPGGVCATPGCGAPASLDRSLWEPSPGDFVCAEVEERA